MRNQYYNQFNNIFRGVHNLNSVGYDDPKYVHVNIGGAVKYIKETLKDDPKNYKFITTIRNPYDRFLSFYFHEKRKGTKITPEEYVKEEHYKKYNSKKFRYNDDIKTTDLIRLESLHDDMKKINDKYNLRPDAISGVCSSSPLHIRELSAFTDIPVFNSVDPDKQKLANLLLPAKSRRRANSITVKAA